MTKKLKSKKIYLRSNKSIFGNKNLEIKVNKSN